MTEPKIYFMEYANDKLFSINQFLGADVHHLLGKKTYGNKMKEKQILNFAILVLITENSECESSDMNI